METKHRRSYSSRDVRRVIGNRSPATLYRWLADPRYNFPKPRKIGPSQTNMWDADEVDAWLAAQLDGQAPEKTDALQRKGDTIETVENSIRVVKIVTSVRGDKKTIAELHMLGDLTD